MLDPTCLQPGSCFLKTVRVACWDTWLYSPLCLLLARFAAGFAIGAAGTLGKVAGQRKGLLTTFLPSSASQPNTPSCVGIVPCARQLTFRAFASSRAQ